MQKLLLTLVHIVVLTGVSVMETKFQRFSFVLIVMNGREKKALYTHNFVSGAPVFRQCRCLQWERDKS